MTERAGADAGGVVPRLAGRGGRGCRSTSRPPWCTPTGWWPARRRPGPRASTSRACGAARPRAAARSLEVLDPRPGPRAPGPSSPWSRPLESLTPAGRAHPAGRVRVRHPRPVPLLRRRRRPGRHVREAVLDRLADAPAATEPVCVGRRPTVPSPPPLAARRADTGSFIVDPGATPALPRPAARSTALAECQPARGAHAELVDVLGRLGLRTLGALGRLAGRPTCWPASAPRAQAAHRLARGLDARPPARAPPAPDLAVSSSSTRRPNGSTRRPSWPWRWPTSCTRRSGRRAWPAPGWPSRPRPSTASTSSGAGATRARLTAGGHRRAGPLAARRVAVNGSAAARPTAGITRLTLVPDEVVAAKGRQLGFWGGETDARRAGRPGPRPGRRACSGAEAVGCPSGGAAAGRASRSRWSRSGAVDLTGAPGRRPSPTGSPTRGPAGCPPPSPATGAPDPPPPAELVDGQGGRCGVSGRGGVIVAARPGCRSPAAHRPSRGVGRAVAGSTSAGGTPGPPPPGPRPGRHRRRRRPPRSASKAAAGPRGHLRLNRF